MYVVYAISLKIVMFVFKSFYSLNQKSYDHIAALNCLELENDPIGRAYIVSC